MGSSIDDQGRETPLVAGNGWARKLGALGGGTGVATVIDDTSLIVDCSLNESGEPRAVLWLIENGDVAAVDINELLLDAGGWTMEEANAIGAEGSIAGVARIGNATRAVMLIPVY